jgi:hypothetical protein
MVHSEVPTPAKVEIRRNADGLVRVKRKPSDFFGAFIWSEGNFACDCNRCLFFADAAGEVEPDHPCSDGRYSVRLTAIDDGRLLYKDGEWPETAKDQG